MTPAILLAAPAHGQPPPDGFAIVFPFLFVGMWLAITTLLDLKAGHPLLLARFPPVRERLEERFRFASGNVRGVRYGSSLHVGIGRRGLHLASNAIFRSVFHRGVPCIPWSEIRLVSIQSGGFFAQARGSSFEVRALGIPFTIYGRAGRAVEEKLASLGIHAPPPSRPLVRERRF